MASDDLRARIVEALNTTPAALVRDSPEAAAFHAEQLTWEMISARHDRHSYMMTCALCRGEAETLADAVLAAVQPELDRHAAALTMLTARSDRCPLCCCDNCNGLLADHTETGCACGECTAYPEYACSLAEFVPSERTSLIAQQLGPLLSSHLNEKARLRCLAVAHAAHHALHTYDFPGETDEPS